MSKLKLYDLIESQNGYKIRLALSNLKTNYELIPVDLMNGEHRKEWFLKLNPNGKIPVLVDNGFPVWESNAILLYLGRKYAPNNLIPQDIKKLGIMLEWLFFESSTLQKFLQPARFITKFFPKEKVNLDELNKLRKDGTRALKVIEEHLSKNNFFTGDYSMADISCYGQIYPAEEGGFDMSQLPNIKSWQKRVESQPGYVEMRPKVAV